MAPPLTPPPPRPSKQPKGSGSEREESLERGTVALKQFFKVLPIHTPLLLSLGKHGF